MRKENYKTMNICFAFTCSTVSMHFYLYTCMISVKPESQGLEEQRAGQVETQGAAPQLTQFKLTCHLYKLKECLKLKRN